MRSSKQPLMLTAGFVLVVVLVGLLTAVTGSAAAQSAGFVDIDASDLKGSGTTDDPYLITNASELQAVEDDLTAHYELGSDIDATVTVNWNSDKGFTPIGTTVTPFIGSVDGAGHEINGLTIDRPAENNVGLFGVMNGTVKNTEIVAADITGDGDYPAGVGIIAGRVGTTGKITDVTTGGEVSGSEYTGGLVGNNAGRLTNVSSTAGVSIIDGRGRIGGLVGGLNNGGNSSARIESSYATGDVDGGPGERIGGLVGNQFEDTVINDSYATGSVTGDRHTGGLVGDADGNIVDSSSIGDVTWSAERENGTDDDVYAVAIGGLAGSTGASAIIRNSSAQSNVIIDGDIVGRSAYLGGIVGSHDGHINRSTVTGDLRIKNNPINRSGSGRFYDSRVGGVAGNMDDTGSFATSSANVTIIASRSAGVNIGGLVGVNFGRFNTSYVTGSITIQNSNGTNEVGGLVGESRQSIPNLGYTAAEVRKSYAAVDYNFDSDTVISFGGVIGDNKNATEENREAAIAESIYWDQDRGGINTGIDSGQGNTTDVQGLSSNQMTGDTAQNNMPGLDFNSTWETRSDDYPALRSVSTANPEPDPQVELSDVQLNPPTVGSAQDHTLNFTVSEVSADGNNDTIEIIMPNNVTITNVRGAESTDTNYQVTVVNSGNPIELVVDPDDPAESVTMDIAVTMELSANDS